MKAILEFDLSDPFDRDAHTLACNAGTLQTGIQEFYHTVIRHRLKYGQDLSDGDVALLEQIKKEFFECMEGTGYAD